MFLSVEGSKPLHLVVYVQDEAHLSSGAELSRLGEALREDDEQQVLTPYAIAAIRLLLLTGARKSEILSLRWDYVDPENRLLRLPRSKTGLKSIYLTTAAAEILQSLPRVQGNPFVIVGERPGHTSSIYRSLGIAFALEPVLKMCGFMTCATPMPAWELQAAYRCCSWGSCWVIHRRLRLSAMRIWLRIR